MNPALAPYFTILFAMVIAVALVLIWRVTRIPPEPEPKALKPGDTCPTCGRRVRAPRGSK